MTPASRRAVAPPIRFAAVLDTIESQAAMRLPDEASTQLPSRGQVAVRGAIDGQEFRTVLEPDGRGGHWMRIDRELQRAAGMGDGDTARLTVEVMRDWPEPDVPHDLAAALAAARRRSRMSGRTSRRWPGGNGSAG